ncbi:MAG: zf-HC2 domain-containing protein [Sulfuritalea sp.]|nr:zf-HC2 domain-containing protein [Sulfuritalea sp.]
MNEHRPDMIELSAYFDGELDPARQRSVAAHLAACPACAAQFDLLRMLAADFERLPAETLGFDLAGVIEGRLAAAPRPQPRHDRGWRGLLPVSVGAAASVACGIAMGFALFGGAAAAPRVALMSVFDTMPPGSLCIGLESCYTNGAKR